MTAYAPARWSERSQRRVDAVTQPLEQARPSRVVRHHHRRNFRAAICPSDPPAVAGQPTSSDVLAYPMRLSSSDSIRHSAPYRAA